MFFHHFGLKVLSQNDWFRMLLFKYVLQNLKSALFSGPSELVYFSFIEHIISLNLFFPNQKWWLEQEVTK